tara:strand:+ start:152 stop:382 length:231 start_codon:yes stop_codon:yes gene_type:complete
MLSDPTKPRVMLDVRNQYEYDVGHFDGAVRPQGVAQFSESDAASFGLDPNNATAKEETEVTTLALTLTLGLRRKRR